MSAPASLARARNLVAPALRDIVESLAPELRLPAAYHFGFVDAEGNPVSIGSGKGMRSAMAMLSAEAVGASGAVAVPGAVALDLIHNFSLVHDDIIDGDETRRHRPTVWAVFGVDRAVIVGDALHAQALDLLLSDPTPGNVRAAGVVSRATAAMIEGQSLDMAFDDAPVDSIDVVQVIDMEQKKTGALFAAASSIGATLAEGAPETIAALHDFGLRLGIAFQAVDDLLGIWGDPSVTGKSAGNDLREGKRSLPVAYALEAGADGLAAQLEAGIKTDDDVAQAAAAIEASGGRTATAKLADEELTAALASLAAASLEPAAAAELEDLARFVTQRDN